MADYSHPLANMIRILNGILLNRKNHHIIENHIVEIHVRRGTTVLNISAISFWQFHLGMGRAQTQPEIWPDPRPF